jgi:hypothetical protein
MFQKLFAGKILEVSRHKRLARGTLVFKKLTQPAIFAIQIAVFAIKIFFYHFSFRGTEQVKSWNPCSRKTSFESKMPKLT